MSSPNQNPSARPSARRAESRGSVLIFVVGVLLLLAIVATAFLGTSRSDRTATQQNAFNTQIDLLLEGVVNAAKSKVGADESIPGSPNYESFDAYTYFGQPLRSTDDNWLASRVPTGVNPFAGFSANELNVGLNEAIWPVVTGGVLGDRFESPALPQNWPPTAVQSPYTGPLEYSQRENLIPTYMTLNGVTWPAFAVDTYTSPLPGITGGTAVNQFRRFLAADADGDGVADSPLFRLPIGQLAGVTYYGAVRIIDNSSAVNVNTAMSRDWEFQGDGQGAPAVDNGGIVSPLAPFQGAFPSSVGLIEMLRSGPNAAVTAAYPASPQFDNMTPTGAPAAQNEFNLLNVYRYNFVTGTTAVRPLGVLATPSNGQPHDAPNAPRNDFNYITMGESLTRSLTERMGNAGYTSGTSAVPVAANSAFRDSLLLAARFAIGSADDANNLLISALPLTLTFDPIGVARTRPYDGSGAGNGVDGWFVRNFDFNSENVNIPSPLTFMNRRTLLTGYNAVSNQDPRSGRDAIAGQIIGPAYLFNSADLFSRTTPPLAAADYHVVYQQQDSSRNVIPAGPTPPASPVIPPMYIAASTPVAPGSIVPARSKIAVNQARFEELFYGFLQVMGRTGFTGQGDGGGTPYSLFYSLASAARAALPVGSAAWPAATINTDLPANYYRDPYIGMRFTASTTAGTLQANRLEPAGFNSVVNGQASVPEQHPLRQFRSVLRAAHNRLGAVAAWSANTPYLPADQVAILRAAIAAANAEGLRNSSAVVTTGSPPYTQPDPDNHNDRITMHRVPLVAFIPPTAAADADNAAALQTNVVANVFGLRRQPYITEVYANTDVADVVGGPINPKGYIAIKITNPHPVPISLQNCRLLGLRRYRELPAPTTPTPGFVSTKQNLYPNMEVLPPPPTLAAPLVNVNDQLNLSSLVSNDNLGGAAPWVIPANGALIIENYAPVGGVDAASDAGHRPASVISGLFPATGPVNLLPGSTYRVSYLPNLHSVVYDREMVLMRPLNATPPDRAAGTPLVYTYENAAVSAAVTADPTSQRIDRFAPLDSYDFTGLNYPAATSGPLRVLAQLWHYARPTGAATPWQFVYPGRYDGNQSIVAGGLDPRPRQQGTQEGYDAAAPASTTPGITPGGASTFTAFTLPTQPTFLTDPASVFYPDSDFRIQLNVTGWPSDQALRQYLPNNVNRFPYGGFRRTADIMQVPFIGSYTIQTEENAATDPTTIPRVNAKFVEVNPVTMDAALAEDTDTDDNPLVGEANGSLSREQIGRFAPLRASLSNGNAVAETLNADPIPKHSIFYNNTFIDTANAATGYANGDPRRYQDDLSDEDFRTYGTVATNVPPQSTNQTYTNRYQWASTLFDHFTMNGPSDDSFAAYPTQPKWQPSVDYSVGDTVQFGSNTFICIAPPPAVPVPAVDPPPTATLAPNADTVTWQLLVRTPVKNGTAATPGDHRNLGNLTGPTRSFDYLNTDDNGEALEPVQGVVNINTAPVKVLAMIPWVKPGDNYTFTYAGGAYPNLTVTAGTDNVPDNEEMAKAIAIYRDGALNGSFTVAPANEPFKTPFDIYKVPAIRQMQNTILAAGDPATADGDYSGTPDAVRNDFEEQYLLLNRVSNLITTRSDTFTAYVLVQGWRNIGTNKPELVTQRRAAVMLDRSRVIYNGSESMKQLSKVQTQ
ncbi:MAG: hypothetical protein JWM57_2964 [Phycisphaerales bacterium]|nr:hypothetical protein [Phycisphaerales bacterium]